VNRLMVLLTRRRRGERLGLALIVGCTTLVAVAFGTVVFAEASLSPEAVTAKVTLCDLHAPGTAQVAFNVTNGDRVLHGYRVTVTVLDGSTTLGTGVALVNHVDAGTTAGARALIALTASGPRATCSARAETFTGDIGHYSGAH
jgi:hypothetical protein